MSPPCDINVDDVREEQRAAICEQESSALRWLPAHPVDHPSVGWGENLADRKTE